MSKRFTACVRVYFGNGAAFYKRTKKKKKAPYRTINVTGPAKAYHYTLIPTAEAQKVTMIAWHLNLRLSVQHNNYEDKMSLLAETVKHLCGRKIHESWRPVKVLGCRRDAFCPSCEQARWLMGAISYVGGSECQRWWNVSAYNYPSHSETDTTSAASAAWEQPNEPRQVRALIKYTARRVSRAWRLSRQAHHHSSGVESGANNQQLHNIINTTVLVAMLHNNYNK
ncbi:hypothetical protein CBL_05527 [Carabus blaptoides fortunei]